MHKQTTAVTQQIRNIHTMNIQDICRASAAGESFNSKSIFISLDDFFVHIVSIKLVFTIKDGVIQQKNILLCI